MTNYLEDAYILSEMNKSWLSYCWSRTPEDRHYDQLITSRTQMTDPSITYRLKTYEHIPVAEFPNNKKRCSEARIHHQLSFIPFIHIRNNQIVLKSHHLDEHTFSDRHGSITPGLARAYMLMIDNISRKGNWAGYGAWLEEMQSSTALHIIQNGLQFNQFKYDRPFTFLTQLIQMRFRYVLKMEKRFHRYKHIHQPEWHLPEELRD